MYRIFFLLAVVVAGCSSGDDSKTVVPAKKPAATKAQKAKDQPPGRLPENKIPLH
jgi:hypothetical protein